MDDINEEIKGYNERLLQARSKRDRTWEGEILFNLGIIYSTIPDKIDAAKAIEYHQKAIEIFREERDWFFFYRASESLGSIYELLLRGLPNALKAYEAAIQQGGPVLPGSLEEKRRKYILHDIARVKADMDTEK